MVPADHVGHEGAQPVGGDEALLVTFHQIGAALGLLADGAAWERVGGDVWDAARQREGMRWRRRWFDQAVGALAVIGAIDGSDGGQIEIVVTIMLPSAMPCLADPDADLISLGHGIVSRER